MKLKLTILTALFAAGVLASFALADGGKHGNKADACREVHISGTIAPQTLAVTVDRANDTSLIPAGTQVSLAVGAAGQTVRLRAEACATGTGSSLVLTVKRVELRAARVATTVTGTTQTGTTQTGTTQTGTTQTGTTQTGTTQTGTTKGHEKEHGDDHGHKHGTTTTAATTTTATTTTGTTTTRP